MRKLLLPAALAAFLVSVHADTPPPASNDYHAWKSYASPRFPLVVYSQETSGVAEAVLFRSEQAMAGFERDYPGFHFHPDNPVEVLVGKGTSKYAGKVQAETGPVAIPLTSDFAGRADQSSLDRAAMHVLYAELEKTEGDRLPEWFRKFVLMNRGDSQFSTGVAPLFQINPSTFQKAVDAGHFLPLDQLPVPPKAQPEKLFDDNPENAWGISGLMYLLYAQQAPDGRALRDALAGILTAASDAKAKPETVKGLVASLLAQSSKWTPKVQVYWNAVVPEDYVLSSNLECSARLWAALAAYSNLAGTHYASFSDLAAAIRDDKLPLPANVPHGLVFQANVFLDRDGSYELGWDGATAILRETAREGFGFNVHATPDHGWVNETLERFTAGPKDLAKLPDPGTNPYHSDHYLAFTNGTALSAGRILQQADLYYDRVTSELPWPQSARHSRFVMYYYGDAWKSGLFGVNYFQPETGATYVSPLGIDTMRHEMTHQVVDFGSKGRFTWWFNEGIAEYYGCHIIYGGDGFLGPYRDPDEVAGLQRFMAGQWPGHWGKLTFAQLLHLDPEGWDSYKHGGYTIAWSIVYYLINGDNGAHRALFDDYMKAVAANTGDAKARDDAFNAAVEKLEPNWRAYWEKTSSHADADMVPQGQVRVTRLILEDAVKQGHPELLGKVEAVQWLLKKQGISVSADRIPQAVLDEIGHQWDPRNKWAATGTGDTLHVTCDFFDGTSVDAWRDAATKLTTSRATLSPAALAKETTPTYPPKPKAEGKVVAGDENKGSPATRPSAPSPGGFAPSAPRPAIGAPVTPPTQSPIPTANDQPS